ncbi:uncharacterized protein LOC105845617 isoform X2 [Hydra vulgaris]|uniref:Uncharacterized protein LOC105845617 isoform X2 n=1 Tax=Hydra vulgaris TaxID=6087 RepID=A0ABM4DBT2_HYDVU
MTVLILLPLSRRTIIGTALGSNQSSIDFSRDSYIALPVCGTATNGLISFSNFTKIKNSIAHAESISLLESINYSQYRIGIKSEATAAITLYGTEEFRIVKAFNGRADSNSLQSHLTDGAISLQSVKENNKYLRYQGYILKLHPVDNSALFNNDASFIVCDNKNYPGYVSFGSTNYPGHFLRQGYTVKLNNEEPHDEIFRRDATFRFVQPGVCRREDDTIQLNNWHEFIIVKALNGRIDSVSLQSTQQSNKYLCHQNYILELHSADLYSELYKNDASFIICQNYYHPEYITFESTNYPEYFLRHQDFTVKLQKEEPLVSFTEERQVLNLNSFMKKHYYFLFMNACKVLLIFV